MPTAREVAQARADLIVETAELVERFNIRQLRVGKGHRFGGRWAKALTGTDGTAGGYRLPHAAHSELPHTVTAGHVTSDTPLAGGIAARTSLVTYANGRKTVRKRLVDYHSDDLGSVPARQQGDAEQLASLLAAAVGAHTPAVHRDAPDVIHMDHVDGETGALLDFYEQRDQFHTPAGQRLGLLDLLTGNQDRHEFNWIRSNGTPHGVDHSFAWMDTDTPETMNVDSPFVDAHFGTAADGWRDNTMSRDELDAIRARLEALRPDFEQLGRGDWLDFALTRLAQVRARATDGGTRDSDHAARIRALLDRLPDGQHYTVDGDPGRLTDDKFLALALLHGRPGRIHAVTLSPDARIADENDLWSAAREVWPDLSGHFGAMPFPPDLAADPQVRERLAADGFAGVEYRSPETNYEPSTMLWPGQPTTVTVTVDIPEHDRHALEGPVTPE